MSRAGRKRAAALRKSQIPIAHPTEPVRSPNEVARSQPHRMRLYEDACDDARCATPFGQLNWMGAIPDDLFRGGQAFAAVVRRLRECYGPRMAPSIAGVGQPGGGTGAEIGDAAERRAEYDNAMGGLAKASKQARATTLWVVVEGGRVPAKGFAALMDGLRALKVEGRQ